MNVVEMLQKQFQDSATNLQTVQRDYSKVLADRQTLDSQLNENRQVTRAQLTFPVGVSCQTIILNVQCTA